MSQHNPGNSYRIINLSFTGVILSIILYSLVLAAGHGQNGIPSGAVWLTGKPSPSTGLSRSFSKIVVFDFRDARQYNPHGIRIFMFFMVQLMLRLFLLILVPRTAQQNFRLLILADTMFSVLVFSICFWPFLTALVQQLSNT